MTTADRLVGGRAMVETLASAGIDHVFGVPGESFLGFSTEVDADDRTRLVSTRHEEGAAFMACGYATTSGHPAVCLGTRMVGAGHLAIGIHTAMQDSIPLIAILGQVKSGWRHREAFQEAELASVFAPLVKWSVEVARADRLAELTARAIRIAQSGRPGPVVLAVPEDLLNEMVDAPARQHFETARPAPDPAAVRRALEVIRSAARPVMIVGGGVTAAGAGGACVRLAEHEQIPVLTAWRRPDAFPNDHPLYLGWAGLRSPRSPVARLEEADAILAIGTRLGELTALKYRIPSPSAQLVHVDVSAEQLGGHVQADVPVLSDAALFADALLAVATATPLPASVRAERRERAAAHRRIWEAETTPGRGRARVGHVDQQAIAGHLRRLLPSDAIFVTDAGNFAAWPARFLRWNAPGTFLGPTSGAMGYGVPAAIGAKLARPGRPVVVAVGDGGFGMTGMEVETAVRAGAPIIVLVFDNRQYGTIRMHQERDYPGKTVGANLGPIDFAQLGESLGAIGHTIRDDEMFPDIFQAALTSDRPVVIHLCLDADQVSVGGDG